MTKIDSPLRIQNSAVIWLVLAALAVFVYFFGLTIPLVGPDEPRYAQVAREMFERGDWITPTLGGYNWFEKPALLYWLEIVSYKIFGVSEFAARFGSALFGLGTIFSLWVLGRKAEASTLSATNNQQSTTNDFAKWLALIAASTIGIIVFSRGASFDIILTFPMTAALVSFYIFDQRERFPAAAVPGSDKSAIPLISFYFFIGVSLLAKGLVGIVLPLAIVGFYYFISWRLPNRSFIFSLFWGTLLAAAVASIWYLPMYNRHGYAFIDEFFVQHHFQRFTSNKYQHPQPFHFFFWVLPLMTIPWLPFFLAAMWKFVKSIFQGGKFFKNPPAHSVGSDLLSPRLPISTSPLLLFSFAWLLVPIVFFSFSGSKLPGYVLPSVPAAIVLTAHYVWQFVQGSRHRAAMVQLTALIVFITTISLLIFVVPRFADTDSVKGLVEAANQRGYSRESVLSLHMVSHNAEFYAGGRLLRDESGRQKKLLGPAHVLEEIKRENGKRVLVLVPLEYLSQLTTSDLLKTEVLKDNGELAIVAATAK